MNGHQKKAKSKFQLLPILMDRSNFFFFDIE
jgi:hypothetical protein